MLESITTSIPGIARGSRNWDFRYSWLRNLAWSQQALAGLGELDSAKALFAWVSDIVIRDGAEALQPIYCVDGGKSLPERDIPTLQGYQGSRPVRVGNLAAGLFHLDPFGQVLLAAEEHHRLFGKLDPLVWGRLADLADYVSQAWRRPDQGPWESRSRPEHYVVSKVYCWAALDRAIQLAQRMGVSVSARWETERDILHQTICNQGYDQAKRSFVRSFGDREMDSSALMIPLLGFLPFEDPRIQNTLIGVQEELSDGAWIHRFRGADGVPGMEGGHLSSTFQFISCLALSGRVEEASDRLADLCAYSTPLGMFGEQINPSLGETTGNFPCASAHIALINAALYVNAARGRIRPGIPLLGPKPMGISREA